MIGCLVREPAVIAAGAAPPTGSVAAIARACSPRVTPQGDRAAIFDASGLSRAIGPPGEIARQIVQMAERHGMAVRLALASTQTAAWLLAHACRGVTIVPPGSDAAALAPLPMSCLTVVRDFESRSGVRSADLQVGGTHVRSADLQVGGTHAVPARTVSPRRGRAPARHYRIAPGPDAPAVLDTDGSAMCREMSELLSILQRWGLRTLGDLARLPRADVHARLGEAGVRLHQAACGEDASPFHPADEAPPIVERIELEWPIEGLEPLSFVLARLCDALESRLERADRGAIVVTTRCVVVTRDTHTRVLHLPAAMRDARMLRTLILLDLESHPPPAGIDVVEIQVDVAPGRIVQGTLLARPLPSAEQVTTLLARLRALMGETRVGAPALVDSHDEREIAMAEFKVDQDTGQRAETKPSRREGTKVGKSGPTFVPHSPFSAALPNGGGIPVRVDGIVATTALRRCRLPIAARVTVDGDVPAAVWPSARRLPGGQVLSRAGPWRSSGRWWTFDSSRWDREIWDIEIATGDVYRLSHDRLASRWFIEGVVD
jgi:protein ImuB